MKQTLRIAYIASVRIPTEKAHGAQIMKTCEALAALGHTITLIVPTRRNAIPDDAFDYYGVKRTFVIRTLPSIDLVRFGPLGFWISRIAFAFVTFAWAERERPDLAYGRDELSLFLLGHAGIPTVFEDHEGRWNFLVRRLIALSPVLVVISGGLRDAFARRGVPREKIIVAHDAVDLDAFADPESKAAARVRLGLPANAKIALYIGRLDGWKGVETLYEAAKLLPEDILVAVIGEGGDLAALHAAHPRVRFLGARPYRELPDNQAAADVLVLPNTGKNRTSAEYTSPLKLFTYMTSGRSIVASDLPSIREVLTEELAYFARPDDPADFARAIQEALKDRARAARAREAVAAYTWKARATRILSHPAFAALSAPRILPLMRITRYGISGLISLVTNVGLLFVCVRWLGLDYLTGTTIAFTGTIIVSFLLQKFWTFEDPSRKGMHYQFSGYVLFALLNLFVNAFLMYVLVGIFAIHYLLAQIFSSGTIAIYGFFVYRYIFNRTTIQ